MFRTLRRTQPLQTLHRRALGTSATLRDGTVMPTLALGTWKSPVGKTGDAVEAAIKCGYRNLDCANDYGNEPEIGETLSKLFAEGVVRREDLFVQAKLWNSNHRPEHVRPDIEATLRDLQLDYLDSFVIHWPQAVPSSGRAPALNEHGPFPAHHSEGSMFPLDDEGYYCSDDGSHYVETWAAMEELVDDGLARTIGLSNFNRQQIREVLDNASKHLPAVLQNECHPYLQQKDLVDFCKISGIQFQAFSALGSSDRPYRAGGSITSGDAAFGVEVLENPVVQEMAAAYGKTPAQLVLRWNIQRGVCVVAKSVTPSRIAENAEIFDFELSAEDLQRFDELNIGWRHLMWAETAMHVDYPFKDELPHGYQVQKPSGGSTAFDKKK